MVPPPIEGKRRLVYRDDPLVEGPRAADQPTRERLPPDLVTRSVLEDLPRLLRVIPVAVLVLDLLDSPD